MLRLGSYHTIAAPKYIRFIIRGYQILHSEFQSVHHCAIVTTWLVKLDNDKAAIIM